MRVMTWRALSISPWMTAAELAAGGDDDDLDGDGIPDDEDEEGGEAKVQTAEERSDTG